MDAPAKEFAQTCRSQDHPYDSPQLLYEKWAYKIDGVKQTSFSVDSIYAQVYGSKLQEYWIQKDDLPSPQTPILWEEARLAYCRLPLGLRRFRVKFLSQHCGLGIRLQRRGERLSSACLLCPEQFEDRDHVFWCRHGGMREKFLEKKFELNLTLKKEQTCPDLTAAILCIFGNVGQNHPLPTATFPPTHGVCDAAIAQEGIGYMNFVLGHWTTKWLVVQQLHFERIKSKRSPRRWASAIIHKLLLISWDLWKYRNGLIHAPTGPISLQEHHTLNLDIDAQFEEDFDELYESDKYLYRNLTQEEMYKWDAGRKRQWLQDVNNTWEQEEDLTNQVIPVVQLQNSLAQWLGLL